MSAMRAVDVKQYRQQQAPGRRVAALLAAVAGAAVTVLGSVLAFAGPAAADSSWDRTPVGVYLESPADSSWDAAPISVVLESPADSSWD